MSLSALKKQRDESRKSLKTIFDAALSKKGDGSNEYDFRKVDKIDGFDGLDGLKGTEKSVRIAEIVQEINSGLDDVCKQIETLEGLEKAANDFDDAEHSLKHPGLPNGNDKNEVKSVGQQVTEHQTFKNWLKGSKDGQIVIPNGSIEGLKALFQTSAGWLPESTRTGQVVDAVTRPLQILDIMPVGQTGQANVVYMAETTRTHAAAEAAEGGTYAESTFVLAEQTSPVRKIADSVPVTDEQLEDVPMVQSYLDGRLRFGVRQRLDQQIISGDGIAPNLDGILNVSGIQTQAKGADPVPDAIYKAGTKLRVTGRVVPTHVVMHPNDWQEVRLLRTADGIYIWGNPSESGPERIWGWPVVQNESLSENTGLIGSFESAWISLVERRGILIERGFTGTQFTEGKQTIRASMRAALVVFRPAAFATITGI